MCQIELLSGSIRTLQNHLAGKSNLNVTTVDINYLQLHQIPLEIGKAFPNLKALYIFGGQMTSVSSEHLQNMPNLRVLSIQNNTEIQVLHSNLFEYTRKLERIIFKNNSLDVISHKTFHGLNLSLVQLEKNQCVDLIFKDEAIANLSSYLMKQCHGPNEMFCQHNSVEKFACTMRQYQFIDTLDMRQISVLGNYEKASVNELTVKSVHGKDKTEKRFPSFFLEYFEDLEIFIMPN